MFQSTPAIFAAGGRAVVLEHLFSVLFDQILLRAKRLGLNQKDLAARAGVRQETLSRVKKRGTIDALTLEKLVKAVEVSEADVPSASNAARALGLPLTPIGLKDPKWMLAWSNPNVDDAVLIRKALATARFSTILQACLDFGIARVVDQWAVVSRSTEVCTHWKTTRCLT